MGSQRGASGNLKKNEAKNQERAMDAAEKYKANVLIPKVHLKQFVSLLIASMFGMGRWKRLMFHILFCCTRVFNVK